MGLDIAALIQPGVSTVSSFNRTRLEWVDWQTRIRHTWICQRGVPASAFVPTDLRCDSGFELFGYITSAFRTNSKITDSQICDVDCFNYRPKKAMSSPYGHLRIRQGTGMDTDL